MLTIIEGVQSMDDTNLEVLNDLHNLISHNVIGDKQYNNRYNGFTAELDFSDWFSKNRKSELIDGGMFLPVNSTDNPFEDSIYFTSSEDSPETYKDIYHCASKLARKGQFFIRYDITQPFTDWNRAELFLSTENGQSNEVLLHIPFFEVYTFEAEKNTFSISSMDEITKLFTRERNILSKKVIPEKLKNSFMKKFQHFDSRILIKLYLERLFFDGYLGLIYTRGAPLDIDSFVLGKNGKLLLLEIKEKDVSKRDPKGFGMDLRRIDSLGTLSEAFDTKSFYIVRHINNQIDRMFVDWRIIPMDKFRQLVESNPVVQGGSGLRSRYSDNPTRVCEFEHFILLK